MADHRSVLGRLRRRSISVPAMLLATGLITLSVPIWLPVAVLVDVVRLRFRLPIARLLGFGVCWCWIETVGVVRSARLWMVGRAGDEDAHYELMAWWAGALMRALEWTTGISPRIEGAAEVSEGNALVLSRHVSLADSLLSGWALRSELGLRPRYVLKRELLFDPSLDIVGLRLPNHFLDREAEDGSIELAEIATLASGVGPGTVAVIFAEGTRANERKRARALERIGERDPDRARRMSGLRHLLPPRPAGSAALATGAPGADIVLVWHTGFDGLDTFAGMIEHLARPLPPVRWVARRVPRADVPDGDAFVAWLDEQWLRMDAEVDAALARGS